MIWFWWQEVQLMSENPDARRRAVEKLGVSNQPRAVGLLVKTLQDGDDRIRLAAAQALERAGWQSDSANLRGWFLVALQHWDDAATLGVPAVLPLSHATRNYLLRSEAESTLLRIGRAAVAPLVEWLKSQALVLETVLRVGPSVQGQGEGRKATEEFLRAEIAHCVGIIVRFGEPAVQPLVQAVDGVVGGVSFWSKLRHMAGERAAPDPLVAAAFGVQRALESAAEDQEQEVKKRQAAIRGAFVAPLEEALNSSDEAAKRTAASILEKIKKAAAKKDPFLRL